MYVQRFRSSLKTVRGSVIIICIIVRRFQIRKPCAAYRTSVILYYVYDRVYDNITVLQQRLFLFFFFHFIALLLCIILLLQQQYNIMRVVYIYILFSTRFRPLSATARVSYTLVSSSEQVITQQISYHSYALVRNKCDIYYNIHRIAADDDRYELYYI